MTFCPITFAVIVLFCICCSFLQGLPRVLGSLYISCRSRDDVKSLCSLIYACAAEIRQMPRSAIGGGPSRQRQLAEKVPASFVALERIVVAMVLEWESEEWGNGNWSPGIGWDPRNDKMGLTWIQAN